MSKKIEADAIKFIRTVAKTANQPLYAGNSGGKDSAVLDKLLQLSGIEYKSFYANTTIDPPGTISHVRKYYPHTEILQPKETFYELVERKSLPTRLSRYCCEFLKEYGSIGRMVFEGVRRDEGPNRDGRDYIQCDTRSWQKGAKHIYPIYDWTEADVYEFINRYDILLPPHYKYGTRLGCVGCPLVYSRKKKEAEFALYPKYYVAIKRAISRGMSKNPQWKLTRLSAADGETAMQWWLSGKTMNEYFNQ